MRAFAAASLDSSSLMVYVQLRDRVYLERNDDLNTRKDAKDQITNDGAAVSGQDLFVSRWSKVVTLRVSSLHGSYSVQSPNMFMVFIAS